MTKPSYEELRIAKHSGSPQIADSASSGKSSNAPMETRKGWQDCEHVWREVESQFSSEYATEVRCEKCGCPGEKDSKTGDVFWPAT